MFFSAKSYFHLMSKVNTLSVLLCLCGFRIITGFTEVGIYSKLQAAQTIRQSGLIKDWQTKGRPGLEPHDDAQRSPFSEVRAPLLGYYYVSTTLVLHSESKDRVKASILANHDRKRKTGLTGLGSYNRSLTITGITQLQLEDSLSVYVEFPNGSTWIVFPESSFFVQLVYSMSSYPAFHAVLPRDYFDQSSSVWEWERIESWDSTIDGFQVSTGFSPSIGSYCACCDGIYSIYGNIILDPMTSHNVSVALFFQNHTAISEEHFFAGAIQTASIGGIFRLKKGDCVDVRSRSFQGPHSVIEGSGFSLFYLSSSPSPLHAASYRLNTHAPLISATGLHIVVGWTSSSSLFFASSSALLLQSSRYQVQTEGQYFISAKVNLKAAADNPSQSAQLLVIVDYRSSSKLSDASIVSKMPISLVTSLSINGILSLSKGQTISICVYKDGDTQVSPMAGSLFSVAMVAKDWPGVSATLKNNQHLSSEGWNELGGWETGSLSDGLFSFDAAFQSKIGRYTVPLQGTYIVTCSMNLNGTKSLQSEIMVAVNGHLDHTTGLWSIQHSGKAGDARLSVAGLLWLSPGQYLSVFVRVNAGTSWTVSGGSSFTISFNEGKVGSQGFYGVKMQNNNYSTTGWKEITDWKSRDSSLQSGGTWDSTFSRFSPEDDGLYLVTANLILSYSDANEFNALIISNGEKNRFAAGQTHRYLTNSAGSPTKVSLPLSCSLKLTKSDYVSVFVKSKLAMPWDIHGNSSLSIVFVATLKNPNRAGMNAISTHQYIDESKYTVVRYWKTLPASHAYSVYNEQIKLINKPFQYRQFIQVEVTGLYFLEVSVVVIPASTVYTAYSLAMCLKTSTELQAIPITKLSNGTSNFGLWISGLLYLTRGQEVYPCVAGSKIRYQLPNYGGFSVVKIVPPDNNPGLHQITDSVTTLSRDWSVASDWRSKGRNSLYKHGGVSRYGESKMSLSKGTYFITSSFLLNRSASSSMHFCVGPDQCAQCYFQALLSDNSVTLAGSLRLQTDQDIYTCTKGSNVTIARSAQRLPKAGEKSTFFYRHDAASYSSPGFKRLSNWVSDDGQVHQGITVAQEGLYVVSVNLVLQSSADSNVKVIVALNVKGNSFDIPGLNVPVTWVKAGEPIAVGLSSLARMSAGSSISVNVHSDSSKAWNTGPNSTLSAALVTEESSYQGIAVHKSQDSTLAPVTNWTPVEGWDPVKTGANSAKSLICRGQFVAGVSGVYLVLATMSFSIQVPTGTECTIQLMFPVNGDVANSNTLTMSRVIRGEGGSSRTATLSLSSSVFLSKWHAVFPMVRSTPAQKITILKGSSFYVALIDEQRRFSQNCDDIGPHIVFHPPPFQRVTTSEPISLKCEAVSDGLIRYKWFKNNQIIDHTLPNLVRNNIKLSDAGRYMCVAESNNITVTSKPAIVRVISTKPVFSRSHFEVSVDETNLNTSLLLLNFTALTVEEIRAGVSLTIVSGNTNGTFALNPSTSTIETTLTNTSPLDYEQVKKYQLAIKATNMDTDQTTYIFLTINIQDVNDNSPEFTPKIYRINVSEAVLLNTIITPVTARDKDTGDGGRVMYTIKDGNDGGVFDVNSDSGVVFVNKTLDYDSQQSYHLTLEARDLGEPRMKSRTNAQVFITVTDSNDHNPVFLQSKYNFSVAENSAKNVVVGRVQATDKDHGRNGHVLYLIDADNETSRTLSVNSTSGEMSLIGSLDYEVKQSYNFLVTAVDQGPHPRSSAVQVTMTVEDVNDNHPEFKSTSKNLKITELTPVGTEILRVQAHDKDSGSRGEIKTYAITRGNTQGAFTITANGDIVVNRTLDREHVQSYNLTITATDDGSPPKTSQNPFTVGIEITDANDNFPRFSLNTYQATLSEDSTIGHDVIRVQASDEDTGWNAVITYHMDAHWCSPLANQSLTINETTGIVYTTRKIDFDTMDSKVIRFRVEARDGGSPSLMSFAEVEVTVTDANDNSPTFFNLPKTLSIRDDQVPYSTIFTVIARDTDSGIHANITYSVDNLLENGVLVLHQAIFGINSSSGHVFSREAFKKDRSRVEYVLLVTASNTGTPLLSSSANLTIRVDDTNDGAPTFEKQNYELKFSSPQVLHAPLITVNASDKDFGNHSAIDYDIKFYQVKPNCKVNFSIANNGSIFNEGELQAGCYYTLEVTARDRGRPTQIGQCWVTIYIEATEAPKPTTSGMVSLKLNAFTPMLVIIILMTFILALLVIVIYKLCKANTNCELENERTEFSNIQLSQYETKNST